MPELIFHVISNVCEISHCKLLKRFLVATLCRNDRSARSISISFSNHNMHTLSLAHCAALAVVELAAQAFLHKHVQSVAQCLNPDVLDDLACKCIH